MDSCSKRVKPSVPPKPQFLSISKCKSLSSFNNNIGNSYNNYNNNNDATRLLHSETTSPNEDVFNNNNNNNNDSNNNVKKAPGVQSKHNFGTCASTFNPKPSFILPAAKFGNVDCIQTMYRSGRTVNVVRGVQQNPLGRPVRNKSSAVELSNPRESPAAAVVEDLNPHKSWTEYFNDDPIDLTPDVGSGLESYVPLNGSFVSDTSSPDKAKGLSFEAARSQGLSFEAARSQGLSFEAARSQGQAVDSNNNVNVNGKVDVIDGGGVKSLTTRANGAGKAPVAPRARISIRRRPLNPIPKVAPRSFSTNDPLKFRVPPTPSNASPFSRSENATKQQQAASSNDLDILIPVVTNSTDSSRASRRSGRKAKGQPRTQSECTERIISDFSGGSSEAASSLKGGDIDPGINQEARNVLHHRPEGDQLYLPMDRVNNESKRNFITSCTDLVYHQHQAKYGRVETLINESLGVEKKQVYTLPWNSKTQVSTALIPPPIASVKSASIQASVSTDSFADVESRNSRTSSSSSSNGSDNYGTLSDDGGGDHHNNNNNREGDDEDDNNDEEDYVSRDEIAGVDDDESKRSTLNATFEADSSGSLCGMRSLRLSEAVQTSSPHFALPSSSLFFVSSDTSSVASSSLSLNAFHSSGSVRSTSVEEEGGGGCKNETNNDPVSPSSEMVEEAKRRRRPPKDPYWVAKEIVTSEEKFIGVLKLLNEDFPNYVQSERAQGKVTDGPADAKQLMHDLPTLQGVNIELLKQLKERLENWDADPRIADIFIKTGHFLKLYTSYIKNFSQMVQDFDSVRKKNPEFDKSLAEFETSTACNRLALKHYMLKPIQRIPQYKLLLQEYLKCLSPDSPDYANAKEAIPIVAGVSEHANESVRNWENQSKMIQIQSTLQGGFQIIKPDRRFIKEGRLMKLSRKEMQARMFFLFNDLLLYTTPIGANSFKVNQAISLDGLTVNCSTTEDTENEFSIISVERSFTVAASSKEERQQWVSALESAVRDHVETRASLEEAIKQRRHSILESPANSRMHVSGGAAASLYEPSSSSFSSTFKIGDRAPVWIQDERASMCMACTREFSVTFRRHHCRGCGKIVCSNCSRGRAPLKYNGNRPARVCMDCFETLQMSTMFEEEDNNQNHHHQHHHHPSRRATDGSTDASSECLIGRKDSTASVRPPSSSSSSSTFGKRGLSVLFKGKHRLSVSRSLTKPSIFTEVQAFDGSSELRGFLLKLEKRKWKRFWFVLKDRVLYTFKAMQDKAAIRTMPLLSYNVQDGSSGPDNDERTFEIYHDGLLPITLRAETCALKTKWIEALRKAMTI